MDEKNLNEKQVWVNIERQIKKYYAEDWSERDINIAKSFFKAGFNVYPESGYTFQKRFQYEDGSEHEACIDIDEARVICSHFLTFQKKSDITADKQNPQKDVWQDGEWHDTK